MTYRRILVPVDGSRTANMGLREAIRLAKTQKAQILLFHVVDEHYLFMGGMGGMGGSGFYAGDLLDSFRKGGQQLLNKAAALVRKQGLRVQAELTESMSKPTPDLIIRQARKWRADLIVLGTHGRRGVRRLVLGSDAEQVVRASPVPVLLVRAKEPTRNRKARTKRA